MTGQMRERATVLHSALGQNRNALNQGQGPGVATYVSLFPSSAHGPSQSCSLKGNLSPDLVLREPGCLAGEQPASKASANKDRKTQEPRVVLRPRSRVIVKAAEDLARSTTGVVLRPGRVANITVESTQAYQTEMHAGKAETQGEDTKTRVAMRKVPQRRSFRGQETYMQTVKNAFEMIQPVASYNSSKENCHNKPVGAPRYVQVPGPKASRSKREPTLPTIAHKNIRVRPRD